MNIEQALEQLQAAPVRYVPVAALETDEALQPRDNTIVPFREQQRVENRSTEHRGTMLLALRSSDRVQLEPLLAAEIDGSLFLLDGHHRLWAYQRAGRDTLPVRAIPMDRTKAVLLSKLTNCSERSLEMHSEQRRDAAWQYVAVLTHRGTRELPQDQSLRTIAGRFGISKDTVSNMLRKLPKVKPKEFPADKCDPGTGFPRWKVVRDWRIQGCDEQLEHQPMTAQQWTQNEAIRVAKKLGVLETGTTPEAWRLAVRLYAEEASRENQNPDAQLFLADIFAQEETDF